MAWESAEKVQKNDAGEYRALIGGNWVSVTKAQKNDEGQFRVLRNEKLPTETTIDNSIVPQWGRKHPELYGIAGAARETLGPVIEAGTSLIGGVLGAGGGVFGGGPVGATLGGVTGAGLGWGAGKGITKQMDVALGNRLPQTLGENTLETAKDVLTGAAFDAGGRMIIPPLAKSAGWIWDKASGNFVKIKAGKIVQELAGPQITALKAVTETAPANQTAGQAVADIYAPPIQTLMTRVTEKAPYTFGQLAPAEVEANKNILRSISKGGTATENLAAQAESKKALNALLEPEKNIALEAANAYGKYGVPLQAKATQLGEAAAGKVEDVRRMVAAGERAKDLSKTWISSSGGAEGLVRRPIQYTYPGELAKAADKMASQAAEGSLNLGQAARFAQAGADSLAAYGLKPLTIDSLVANVAKIPKNPEYAGNRDISTAINRFIEDASEWTNNGGIIDAHALDSLRKNSVNAAIRDMYPSADAKFQKELAAGVISKIKPLIVKAVEDAGGTGYGKYLEDYAAGSQLINQQKLAAKAASLYKSNPNKFVDLVEGNSPDVVKKIFGSGHVDIAKEMSPNAMLKLQSVAQSVNRANTMASQAKEGAVMYEDVLTDKASKFKIPGFISWKATVTNKTLADLENRVNKKVMSTLVESMKTPQSLNDLLKTVPTSQRSVVLQYIQNDPNFKRLVSTGTNALTNNTNQNALAQ